MASNVSCSSGRVVLVDPNKFDGLNSLNNVPVALEDLNISVSLTSFRRGRTLLTNENSSGVVDRVSQIQVNFIEGTDDGTGKKYLTTKFTDLTTSFDTGISSDETLGITSIDIEFNPSMAPMVTINFIDVRGTSIFQNEENILGNKGNKYGTFFQLPYPMFELEIKGYYGLPVKYCLHLYKFNSKFNSQNGNFEITANFVGYTFAMMSDMILGYLRAIPYTTIGAERFKKYCQDVNKEVLMLDDLTKEISEINNGFKKIGSDSKATVDFNTIKEASNIIDSMFVLLKNLGSTGIPDLNTNKNTYEYIIFNHVEEFSQSQNSAINDIFIENCKTYINKYNELITDEQIVLEDFINITSSSNKNGGKLYKDLTISDLTTGDTNSLSIKLGNPDSLSSITQPIIEYIGKYNQGITQNQKIDIFDLKLLYEKLTTLKNKLATELDNTKKILADEFAEIARNELGFEPTVRPIIEVITASIETFIESIFQVSLNAAKNTERTDELSKKFNDINVSDIHQSDLDNKLFYPWPDYREKDEKSGTYIEKYLGSAGVLDNPQKVDELVFIDDLLRAFRTSGKKNEETILSETENGGTVKWFPVNPLDSYIFTESEPYKRTELLNIDDIIRMLVIRAMTFMGYTNNPNLLSTEEVQAMAEIEVDAMLKNVPNNELKTLLSKEFSNDKAKAISGTTNNQSRALLVEDGDNLKYQYIPSMSDESFVSTRVLPINKGFNKGFWYASESKLSGQTAQGLLFLTNYSGSDNDNKPKVEDGGVYVKILNNLPAQESLPSSNADLNSIFKESLLKKDTVSKETGFNCFGGNYGIQEFANIEWEDPNLNGLNMRYIFYKDSDTGLSYNRKKSGELQSLKNPTKSRMSYLDFGNKKEKIDINSLNKYKFYSKDSDTAVNYYRAGKNRELFKELEKGNSNITYPWVTLKTFDIDIGENIPNNFLSLFGSELYYSQVKNAKIKKSDGTFVSCAEYSKAFLFLHTLPFNIPQDRGNPFSSYEISNLFTKSSGIIHAPRLWCAFIGSILWRDSNEEPIFDENKKIIGGGRGKGDEDVIYVEKFQKPDTYEYFPKTINARNYENIYDNEIIRTIPNQIKNEFKRIFFEFVNGTDDGNFIKWRDLADKLEIFDNNTPDSFEAFSKYLSAFFVDFSQNKEIDFNKLLNYTTTINNKTYSTKKENILKYYNVISVENLIDNMGKSHIFLELTDNTDATTTILKSLIEPVFIVNNSYKSWAKNTEKRFKISVKKETFNVYFDKVKEVLTAKADSFNPNQNKQEEDLGLFGTTNEDVIKLQLYKTCKNIYDKWIGDAKDVDSLVFQCGDRNSTDVEMAIKYGGYTKPRLIDSFRFLTRSFRDIGDKLYINPIPINDMLKNNPNTSAFDLISQILGANDFTFQPLPSFINYKDRDVLESLFKPYNYGDKGVVKCGPSFVCVYAGQPSKHLDFGVPQKSTENKSLYPNDGFDFKCDGSGMLPTAPEDFIGANKTINESSISGSSSEYISTDVQSYEDPVSSFVVRYSHQNQNVFKDIHLDQSEHSETDESIKIQDEISQKGGEGNRAIVGQNIYSVYAVRSYTAKVEMMGNAMIQPMMYFQLDNIPMFHGAYLITKVNHSIKPNSMSTNFTGTRIRYPESKLIDSYDVYMSMVDTLETVSAGTSRTGLNSGTIDYRYDVIPNPDVDGKFTNPYEGTAKITSVPGLRTLDGDTKLHKGVDFGISVGTNLIAVYDGEIETVKFNENGFGLYLTINHGVIGDTVYKTVYGHMSDLDTKILGKTIKDFTNDDINKLLTGFKPNVKVKKGDIIGKSGGGGGPFLDSSRRYNTSGHSTGAHLHWELRIGDKADADKEALKLRPVSGLRFIPAGKDFNYGGGGSTTTSVSSQTTKPTKKETEDAQKIAKNYFKQQGLTQLQTAAIMGNIHHETGGSWNTKAVNKADLNGYPSVGLIQWNGAYVPKGGSKSPDTVLNTIGDTVQKQLDYLVNKWPPYKTWLPKSKTSKTIEETTFLFAKIVEVCHLCNKDYNTYINSYQAPRTKYAKDFYKRFQDKNDSLAW